MLNIGEFAQVTGLTVKALRLYDERRVLVPASVDPASRYRRYSASQLVSGVRLKALREAGVPLAEAARALVDEPSFGAVLADHRATLAAQRQRQDAAMVALESVSDEHQSWHVEERGVAGQNWVGLAVPVREGADDGAESERLDGAFATLWQALVDADNIPSGGLWWCLRAGEESDMPELLCCWPVPRSPHRDWSVPGWTAESGYLPAGVDLVVRWRQGDAVPELDEGTTHPAFVALMVEAEQRGVDLDVSDVRQAPLIDGGEPTGFEVAIRWAGDSGRTVD